jgi:hypothetical protein
LDDFDCCVEENDLELAMGWMTGVQFVEVAGHFLFAITSRLAVKPTHLPNHWLPGTLSSGAKWPQHKTDHSIPSFADVKNVWSYTSTLQCILLVWCLIKPNDKFTSIRFTVISNEIISIIYKVTSFVACGFQTVFY